MNSLGQALPLWRFLSLGVLLALLSGCFARPLPPPSLVLPSAAELQQHLDAAGRRFHSLRGLAKVSVTTGEQNFSLTQVLLVSAPDRLRVEALSPFGTTLLVLAADGEEMTVFLPGQNTFYRGAATAANVARFTRLPLRLEDLVGLLLGDVPRFTASDAMVAQEDGRAMLELTGEGGVRQRFAFDANGRLLAATYLVRDQLQLQVTYNEFAETAGGAPRQIVLRMPLLQVAAEIRFSEVDSNIDLVAKTFRQAPPNGSKVQPLSEID